MSSLAGKGVFPTHFYRKGRGAAALPLPIHASLEPEPRGHWVHKQTGLGAWLSSGRPAGGQFPGSATLEQPSQGRK